MLQKSFLLIVLNLLNIIIFAQAPENPTDISPLLIGESIPAATLIDQTGKSVDIMEVLAVKPTVLVFYRGGWCPFCNKHLGALAEAEETIKKLGYQIVAISPDPYTVIQPTVESDKINYKVFSDPDGSFMKAVGIAFQTPLKTKNFITSNSDHNAPVVLPVPTVMVVNQNGEILFEYINPNYRNRMEEKLLVAVLTALKK